MVLDSLFFLPRGKIRRDKLSFETWEAVKLGKLGSRYPFLDNFFTNISRKVANISKYTLMPTMKQCVYICVRVYLSVFAVMSKMHLQEHRVDKMKPLFLNAIMLLYPNYLTWFLGIHTNAHTPIHRFTHRFTYTFLKASLSPLML